MKNLFRTLAIIACLIFGANSANAADRCVRTDVTATATYSSQEKSAGCDGGASKVESTKPAPTAAKPAVKRAAAKAKPAAETTDSSAVKKFAEFPAMRGYPKEGLIYSDPDGNTFERHEGGSRECKFYVNGRFEKAVFAPIGLDKIASKQYCDLKAQEFYATMTPTTPEATSVAPVVYQAPSSAPATAANPPATSASASSGGYVNCDFKVDGKVLKSTTTATDSACKAWTQQQAKERGLIPAN